MKVEVNVTEAFKRAAKPLIKRYRSFLDDLAELEVELVNNPKLGTPLGGDIFKIRLRISSKAKGKSGGARVISLVQFVDSKTHDDVTSVNLLTVYDKSDRDSISEAELCRLVSKLKLE